MLGKANLSQIVMAHFETLSDLNFLTENWVRRMTSPKVMIDKKARQIVASNDTRRLRMKLLDTGTLQASSLVHSEFKNCWYLVRVSLAQDGHRYGRKCVCKQEYVS